MNYTCPQTGKRINAFRPLRVFCDNEFICDVPAEVAVSGIAMGLYKGVGSNRSIHALLLLKRPNSEFKGPVPRMSPTTYPEVIGGEDSEIVARIYQHSRSAHQWNLV